MTNNGSTVNYTYDAAGNVTNDGLHSYTYDAENRLVSVDGGATAQYRYDHQNRRVTKIVGSSWTHYVWQGSQVIGEHDATTAYSTNPTYQVKSARLDYIYAVGRMIQSRQRTSSTGPWTSLYFLSDRLSVRMTLDTSGSVVGRQAHLPFGEDFGESGSQEKHHLVSYEHDGESGIEYAINREYSAGTGRFQSADPYRASGYMVDPQSWNRYSYTRDNPVNRVDPLGLDDQDPDDDDGQYHYEPPTYFGLEMGFGDGLNNPMARVGHDSSKDLEPNPISFDQCQRALQESLSTRLGKNKGSAPSVSQFFAAESAAKASGVSLSLLLSTWFIENSFLTDPRNNPKGPAYGPMQLLPATARQYMQGSGYSMEEILGDTSSRRVFTGSVEANLTVGGLFLADLVSKTGGNLAMAGAAYLGQNAVIGRTPDQLKGAYKARYNEYKGILSDFEWFGYCMREASRQMGG
ncbi:MAG: RHS repeat-associated core domain-containing protein [Acidobacteriota bacterium]